MRLSTTSIAGLTLLALSGCSRTPAPAPGPNATVTLKDGSTFAGRVSKSDTSAITLQSPTGESRTYPMTQVASVQYADASAQQSLAAQGNLAPTSEPAPAPQAANVPPPPPATTPTPEPVYQPAEQYRTIPAGRTIAVRNNTTIDSETAAPGQTYSGVVAHAISDTTGAIAIPRGATATLVIRQVKSQGEVKGQSELVLDVGSVVIAGKTYRLETSDFVEKGKSGIGENSRTGKFLGGGAALGGIIGAIAGGGKGAAIGAASGVGAGAATQAATRGHAVRVPAETVLSFRLEAPIRIREMK